MLASLLRVLTSVVFLSAVVFTIPLAFDVGGRECGLAFSLALTAFYFVYSTLRLATPNTSRFRYALVNLIATFQWIVIPGLLIWSLNQFSVDSGEPPGWIERTFNRKRAGDETIQQWLYGRHGLVVSLSVGGWDRLMHWSVPVFQLAEGFCSLLVVQAAGQITRWIVNREGGDGWMVRIENRAHPCRVLANSEIDRPTCAIRVDYVDRSLLRLSCYYISRARQRGRSPHWLCRHLRCLPLCLGYRQRPWQSSGELSFST